MLSKSLWVSGRKNQNILIPCSTFHSNFKQISPNPERYFYNKLLAHLEKGVSVQRAKIIEKHHILTAIEATMRQSKQYTCTKHHFPTKFGQQFTKAVDHQSWRLRGWTVRESGFFQSKSSYLTKSEQFITVEDIYFSKE